MKIIALLFFVQLMEILFKYFWIQSYFKFGLPLVQVVSLSKPNIESKKYDVHGFENDEQYLIRDKSYQFSRYVFFRGYVRKSNDNFVYILNLDWNVLVFFSLISSVFFKSNIALLMLGSIIGYTLLTILMNFPATKNYFISRINENVTP